MPPRAYAYDALGHVVSVTDPLGAIMRHEYDAVGRETARVDAAGGRWVTEYDAVGNAVANGRPDGRAHHDGVRRLGPAGRRAPIPLGAATARAFDAVGSVVGETDALGQTTTYGYDARDRMTSATTPAGRDHRRSDTTRTATRHRRRTPWVTWLTVEFDALNRAVAQVAPDGGRS